MYRPYRPSVQLDDVRPKVIALLQAHGPTEAVADVAGVSNVTIMRVYSRERASARDGSRCRQN